jgi:predicted dehydrogenase
MAVIGVGHLGKEHARILASFPDVDLVGVADVDLKQAEMVARRCETRSYSDYRPLLNQVDAATIVVPTIHHHAIAADFLRRGIPLLVEKPLAATLADADDLVELARRERVLLQVGHIERFNPVFEELKGRSLPPCFVECERLGPFSGRSTDIGVVLDLMIHDLDLLLALVGGPVRAVQAVGKSIFGRHEDVASARLVFGDGCVAHLTASRASAEPRRRMRVWTPQEYAGADLARGQLSIAPLSKNLVLSVMNGRRDPGIMSQFPEERFGRHLQAVPLKPPDGDQLTRELQEFVHGFCTGARPRVCGEEGREAVALAMRILESLQAQAREPARTFDLPPLPPVRSPGDNVAA